MSSDATGPEMDLPTTIEHAKRAFALQKYEQAVEHYATALEKMTQEQGDDAPETADLYFAYGRALLENAISQSSVLGKDQPEQEDEDDEPIGSGTKPILSFTGDAEDDSVDLFKAAEEAVATEETEQDAEGDNDEPEDDFNAAWEVFELARGIYHKQNEGQKDDAEIQMKLAETYLALGDVSLETEKFEQAITDYEAGLALKSALLPQSSRQLAEAHYKLSIVLDLTSGRLADAITQAERALESIECRLALLRNPQSGEVSSSTGDSKGKGKGKAKESMEDASLVGLTPAQVETEMKELEGLKEDLAVKIDELKTRPAEPIGNASALAAQALDKELNAGGSKGAAGTSTVNDLTMAVKKKKKPVVDESGSGSPPGKRKADEQVEGDASKKARVDDSK
ncbi:SHNi-TPR domain-containing protein [Mycena indigotica]|uniref:SHNi-TPR domain-containing protein n=1 Tax=Mycena indigotica TaxID=2126181 RepID=A0A8H6WBB8_9AGAR|nr:SHNi-TPR domain-containing protein [Mycena indigotica]KAF7310066.1 SHNi-TPR domain-containing protein [Mycena indigotica]